MKLPCGEWDQHGSNMVLPEEVPHWLVSSLTPAL